MSRTHTNTHKYDAQIYTNIFTFGDTTYDYAAKLAHVNLSCSAHTKYLSEYVRVSASGKSDIFLFVHTRNGKWKFANVFRAARVLCPFWVEVGAEGFVLNWERVRWWGGLIVHAYTSACIVISRGWLSQFQYIIFFTSSHGAR